MEILLILAIIAFGARVETLLILYVIAIGVAAIWSNLQHSRSPSRRYSHHVPHAPPSAPDFFGITPTEFEYLVGRLLVAAGSFETFTHTGQTNDRGVDLVGRHGDWVCVVQCKQYAFGNRVGSSEVLHLLGSRQHHRARYSYLVTTSSYTREALAIARDHKDTLRLIDGEELREIAHMFGS